MSQRHAKSVSEIVEDYRARYPGTERRVLRKLILKEHEKTNPRTLDRHLKRAFSPQSEIKPIECKQQMSGPTYTTYFEELQDIGKVGSSDPEVGIRRLAVFVTFLPDPLRLQASFIVDLAKELYKNPVEAFMSGLSDVVDMLKRSEKEHVH